MKNIKSLTHFLLICFFLLSTLHSFSQQTVWNKKIDALKVFIENRGQFNNSNIDPSKIEYCCLGSDEKFYFTKKGVVIELQKNTTKKNLATWVKGLFKNQTEDDDAITITKSLITAEWLNTSENYSIETEGCADGYYTFDKSKEISYGYKKLIYKNIYPNIDIVYSIPQDSSGIEYSLIVRPGADLSKVKLQYSGDVNQMKLKDGNIEIETPSGIITEHAPISFYQNNKANVPSDFELENKTIAFNIPSYDLNKTIIIDPWVAGLLITTTDIGYNVDYNDSLQLYTYIRSGNYSLYVCKYSQTGILLWTHLVTSSNQYEGDFLVDKNTGRVYISEGFNGGGAYVYSINSSGVSDGWTSQVLSNYVEIWEMLYDDSKDNIIAVGGGTQSNLNGGIINVISGIVNITNFTGFGGICQDIVCGVTDYQGKLFVIYAQTICGNPGQIDNKIELVNSTLNGPVWLAPSGFNAFLESSNHIPPAGAQTCNGFNALAVNDNFLYYYDGGGIASYNKTTGNQIAATSVGYSGTWYLTLNQGGIAVDDCDNVYVGGPNSNILIYKFNGSTFSAPIDLPIGWAGNQRVTDIKYDRNTALLYVSGNSNVAVIEAPINCSTTSSSEIKDTNELTIFPNPAKDFTTLKISQPGLYNVEIIDVMGKVVKLLENIYSDEIKVNTGEFEKGVYLVKLLNELHKEVSVSKLIVE